MEIKTTHLFIAVLILLFAVGIIVRPFPDYFTLIIGVAIGMFTVLVGINIHVDKKHGN